MSTFEVPGILQDHAWHVIWSNSARSHGKQGLTHAAQFTGQITCQITSSDILKTRINFRKLGSFIIHSLGGLLNTQATVNTAAFEPDRIRSKNLLRALKYPCCEHLHNEFSCKILPAAIHLAAGEIDSAQLFAAISPLSLLRWSAEV